MLKFGNPIFLECSSKGDKRFSAFYARIKRRNNESIEEIYQSGKIFNIDGLSVSGLSIREAKGKQPTNIEECKQLYSLLWDEYFQENSELLDIILQYEGFSDIFGQPGHVCQAEEIFRIKESHTKDQPQINTLSVSIIGTAGRKDDLDKLDVGKYNRMVNGAKSIIERLCLERGVDITDVRLTSGGAAWADHIVVTLCINKVVPCSNLTILLPTDIKGVLFCGKDHHSIKTANTANYYHKLFSEKIGRNSILELISVADHGATLIPGDGNFFVRNSDVAKSTGVDGVLIAFTFGSTESPQPSWSARKYDSRVTAREAGLKDGGTADTWNKCRSQKYHIRLG